MSSPPHRHEARALLETVDAAPEIEAAVARESANGRGGGVRVADNAD
jgi:hypothetical protein